MNIAVLGQWHLGTVTAGCLAAAGHSVTGYDPDPAVVSGLQSGRIPVMEPGLAELIDEQAKRGRLRFSNDPAGAVKGAEIVWIAFDTPVDEEDHADVEHVVAQVTCVFPHIEEGVLVLNSSQLPVGTTRRIEKSYEEKFGSKRASFACAPENLRLGQAIRVFTKPDRVVIGLRNETDKARLLSIFRPFTANIEWMRVESAEMTKHAINAFLATSVAFANEIAGICEHTGADAREVERGLKSDVRIGPGAYLSPGSAFAGGTLARDIKFLEDIGRRQAQEVQLISAVRLSNDFHKTWTMRKVLTLADGLLQGKRVTVWGLTYKAGTDTLRRSASVELCQWLVAQGAEVHAHDPAVRTLPPALARLVTLHASAAESLQGSRALILATAWPEYRQVSAETVLSAMAEPVVIDPGRFAEQSLAADRRITYASVGKGELTT